jgi:hypothetical protein
MESSRRGSGPQSLTARQKATASETGKTDRIVADSRIGQGSIIAGNNVFISARYLNINGTIQSGIQALNSQCIRARHDHKTAVSARVNGCLDAVNHFLLCDNFFIGSMATALGAHLIFNMHGRSTKLDH